MQITHTHRVGAIVRERLSQTGDSQAKLAAAIGLSQPGISDRLAGKIPFDVNELAAAAEFLGCTAAELLGEAS